VKVALLPGDGIGPEILREAVRVLDVLRADGLKIETEEAPVGGAAFDVTGDPLPEATLRLAKSADAVLFGAVGGPRYDALPRDKRPEKAILGLRKECDFFANLRPATVFPELADASTLKPEVVSGLDIMIVRELTGDIYFGQPRGITGEKGSRVGFNTMHYTEAQIRRILHVGFRTARQRGGRLCSVDKMNVLETTQLWRMSR
jgi:3-isopropylmalate dehydrogenase